MSKNEYMIADDCASIAASGLVNSTTVVMSVRDSVITEQAKRRFAHAYGVFSGDRTLCNQRDGRLAAEMKGAVVAWERQAEIVVSQQRQWGLKVSPWLEMR